MLAIIKPRNNALKPSKTKASTKPTGITKRATAGHVATSPSAASYDNGVAKRPLNSWMAFRGQYTFH